MHSEIQRHRYINFDDLRIGSLTTRARLVDANRQRFFFSIGKTYEKCGSATCLLFPQFQAITRCDKVSYFFNVSKRVVYERASSGITLFNTIVELGSSNIIAESVNMEVII